MLSVPPEVMQPAASSGLFRRVQQPLGDLDDLDLHLAEAWKAQRVERVLVEVEFVRLRKNRIDFVPGRIDQAERARAMPIRILGLALAHLREERLTIESLLGERHGSVCLRGGPPHGNPAVRGEAGRPIVGSGRAVVIDHCGPNAFGSVVRRSVHQVAVEQEHIARIHQHRSRRAHIVIDDLHVADLAVLTPIRNVFVDPFPMGARQHPQRPVLEGCSRHGHPDPDLMIRLERKIVGVLMPGLTQGTRILEDELREEAIEGWPEKALQRVEKSRHPREGFEHGIVRMQAEDLSDRIFRLLCAIPSRGFGQHERQAEIAAPRLFAGQADGPREHALTYIG